MTHDTHDTHDAPLSRLPRSGTDRFREALAHACDAEAMITGLGALSLHGFAAAPPPGPAERIDVLVPRTRRVRSTGRVRLVRTARPPHPDEIDGLPVAPVPRALADAVAALPGDPDPVRLLLVEAADAGHCEPDAVVRELRRARLLNRPHVAEAVTALLATGRAVAEQRLYEMVRGFGLPDPLWNVDLRLPGGPRLGGVDAYWPRQAVAVELDTRAARRDGDPPDRERPGDAGYPGDAEHSGDAEYARRREHLERLGVTVVRLTPRGLREAADRQAAVVRTALLAAADRPPAAYLVVLPR